MNFRVNGKGSNKVSTKEEDVRKLRGVGRRIRKVVRNGVACILIIAGTMSFAACGKPEEQQFSYKENKDTSTYEIKGKIGCKQLAKCYYLEIFNSRYGDTVCCIASYDERKGTYTDILTNQEVFSEKEKGNSKIEVREIVGDDTLVHYAIINHQDNTLCFDAEAVLGIEGMMHDQIHGINTNVDSQSEESTQTTELQESTQTTEPAPYYDGEGHYFSNG